jgi:hypothetical protein
MLGRARICQTTPHKWRKGEWLYRGFRRCVRSIVPTWAELCFGGCHGFTRHEAHQGRDGKCIWGKLGSVIVNGGFSRCFWILSGFLFLFVFASDSALDEPLMISRLVTCTLTFFICLCFPIPAKVRRKGFRLLCCYGCFHKVGRVHVLLSSIGFTSRIIQGSAASGCRRRLYHRHLLANH